MFFAVASKLVLSAHSQTTATLLDLGATAPTPRASDVVQFSTGGNTTAPDSLNYYTDNQTVHGSGEPGQTFATGTNSARYVLSSFAVMTAGLGSYNGSGTILPDFAAIRACLKIARGDAAKRSAARWVVICATKPA